MDKQMTSKTTRVMAVKALIVMSVLLLAACDGGIFGTGGPDDQLMNGGADTVGLPDESISQAENNVDGVAAGDTDGSANTTDDSSLDAGASDAGPSGGGLSDAGSADDGTADAGTGIGVGSTDGASAGVVGNTDGDSTSGDPTTGGTAGSAVEPPVNPDEMNPPPDTGADNADNQVYVINTASTSLNVVTQGAEQQIDMFDAGSVASTGLSENGPPGSIATNFTITNNDTTELLLEFSEPIEKPSDRVTIVFREDEAGINSFVLNTETKTSDPGLAKVRIVQGDTLGDALIESEMRLVSAGENPGGMDKTFAALSYNRPNTDYSELLAGDYELVDVANRFSPFAVTLEGGISYSLVLVGIGANDILIINDSTGAPVKP